MIIPVRLFTVEEFEALAALPENVDKRLEWLDLREGKLPNPDVE